MKASRSKPALVKKPVPRVAETISAVYGCKWSLPILGQIQLGIRRPGAIERALPGLTTRVQHYYFRRLIELGIVEKTIFLEIPPRVEYFITDYGREVLSVMSHIDALQARLEQG